METKVKLNSVEARGMFFILENTRGVIRIIDKQLVRRFERVNSIVNLRKYNLLL